MGRSPDRAALIVSRSPESVRKRPWLNAWQRLGVVLSCAWVLASVYWDSRIYDRIYWDRREAVEQICLSENPQNVFKCGPVAEPEGFTPPSVFQPQFFLNAIIPVVLGWLATYFAISVVKWILAGRENSN